MKGELLLYLYRYISFIFYVTDDLFDDDDALFFNAICYLLFSVYTCYYLLVT